MSGLELFLVLLLLFAASALLGFIFLDMIGGDIIAEPQPRWTNNNDGTIDFTVGPTDGTDAEGWIERLGEDNLSEEAKRVIREGLVPTEGVTYRGTILTGSLWSSNSDRTSENIRAEAEHRELSELPVEAALLIRWIFSNEEICEMGLYWLVTMHEPIEDSGGAPDVLCVVGVGSEPWLNAGYGHSGSRWVAGVGFAFGSRPSTKA